MSPHHRHQLSTCTVLDPRRSRSDSGSQGSRFPGLCGTAPALLLLLLLFLFACPGLGASAAPVSEIKLLNMYAAPASEPPDATRPILCLKEGFEAALFNASSTTLDGRPITVIERDASDDGNDPVATVAAALETHPDLFGLMGPGLGYQLEALRAAGTLQDSHLIAWGASFAATASREWWGPHVQFFGQNSEVELLMLLRELIYSLRVRRIGFMYLVGGSNGEVELNITRAQLRAVGRDPDADLIIYSADVASSFDPAVFDAFADQQPQATIVVGQAGLHTQAFGRALLSDPRTQGTYVLSISGLHDLLYGCVAYLQAQSPGDTVVREGQMFFGSTTYLTTQTEYAHIRHFNEQMAAFIAAGRSSLAAPAETDLATTDINAGSLLLAGWIAGQAMLLALQNSHASSDRVAFQADVFKPNTMYVIGEDLLVGMFGGDCAASLAGQPNAMCGCNEGGRDGMLRNLLPDLTEVPVAGTHFTYASSVCYPTESFTIGRPIATLALNFTTDDGAAAAEVLAGAQAALALHRTATTDESLELSLFSIAGDPEGLASDVAALHNVTIFLGVTGLVPTALVSSSTSELTIGASALQPHANSGADTAIALGPTLDQQLYVAYSNLALALQAGDVTDVSGVLLCKGLDAAAVGELSALLKRTADTFQLPALSTAAVAAGESAASHFPTSGQLVFLGLEATDIAPLVQHMADSSGVAVILAWDDVVRLYGELVAAVADAPASVLSRLRFTTNLPLWTKGSAAARASRSSGDATNSALTTKLAPDAFFDGSTAHTPLALQSWYAMSLVQSVAAAAPSVTNASAFLDQLYSMQTVRLDGASFGPFVRCSADTAANATSNSVGAAACTPRNYGAQEIAVVTMAQVQDPTQPYLAAPLTPAMEYRALPEKEKKGLSDGAIAGIVVGSVVGGLLIITAIVLLIVCCCRSGNARDNNNAPKDPVEAVTLIFTDIESSTALWAAVPSMMADAVTTHHKIIREAIAKYKCYEVKTIGDSFMIACKDTYDAVNIAGTIQTAFLKHDWKTTEIDAAYRKFELEKAERDTDFKANSAQLSPDAYKKLWNGLRIRVGIHTGLSDIRQDEVTKGYDYYGETSNMAARTEAIGNGGQVLLTEAAWWALSRKEKQSLDATVMGPIALRGVPFPLEIYQVNFVPGRAFGPLRTEMEVDDLYEQDEADDAGDALDALSEVTMTGASRTVSSVITSCLSPFTPQERVKELQPILQKWNIPVPPRSRNVSHADYAQGLINRLAVKMATVDDFRHRAGSLTPGSTLLNSRQAIAAAHAAAAANGNTVGSFVSMSLDSRSLTPRYVDSGRPSIAQDASPNDRKQLRISDVKGLAARRQVALDSKAVNHNPLQPTAQQGGVNDDMVFSPLSRETEL